MYIDLHGHAVKKGCFIFGNSLSNPTDQCSNMLFAKLISMNSLNFDFAECSFTEKLMSVKDRCGLSREGSGRVGIFKATGLVQCYTLECNF